MGATDIERQKPNVFRMKLLGADIRPVTSGAGTLKDAMNEALRDWVTNVNDTFYIIGTVAGPHPYPAMVRDFQSIIGRETKQQILEREGRLPDTLIACIGGGSNAMGLFHPFLDNRDVNIIGVEAGGHGLDTPDHAASLAGGTPGVLHGNRTYLLQDDDGQIIEGHSISAGLIIRALAPNMLICAIRVASIMCRPRMVKRWKRFSSSPVWKALFRRLNRAMRWRMSAKSPVICRPSIYW